MATRIDPTTKAFALGVLARSRHRDGAPSTMCPSCGYRPQVTRAGRCSECSPRRRVELVSAA